MMKSAASGMATRIWVLLALAAALAWAGPAQAQKPAAKPAEKPAPPVAAEKPAANPPAAPADAPAAAAGKPAAPPRAASAAAAKPAEKPAAPAPSDPAVPPAAEPVSASNPAPGGAMGEPPPGIALPPTDLEPPESLDSITLDMIYGRRDGMALTMDMMTPKKKNEAGLVFFSSRGWLSLWAPPHKAALRLADLLADGFTIFIVRHPSSPTYKVPDISMDCRNAIRYIKMNAKEFGINPDKLGLMGADSGGHLALLTAVARDDGFPTASDPMMRFGTRVAAVVAFSPMTDLRGRAGKVNDFYPSLDFDPKYEPNVSPAYFVSKDDPPILIIHGDQDEVVSHKWSEQFIEGLKMAGTDCKFIKLKGAKHGFTVDDDVIAMKALREWFNDKLLKDPSKQKGKPAPAADKAKPSKQKPKPAAEKKKE